MNNPRVTFRRVTNGEFDALLDGAPTEYGIVNGSLGLSGRIGNTYGIVRAGRAPRWIGTLQDCKKILTYTLTKA